MAVLELFVVTGFCVRSHNKFKGAGLKKDDMLSVLVQPPMTIDYFKCD